MLALALPHWFAFGVADKDYLAIDLGAESGRVMAGTIASGRLTLRELHRFQNIPVRTGQSLCWDMPALRCGIDEGLRRAADTGVEFRSVSTDSWGVDYALFDANGQVIEPVYHYRDARTKAGVERALQRTTWERIFAETGIQYMPINTLFQLASEPTSRLAGAAFLLGIGDAVNYLLSGVARIEVSMASTFQLYNPQLNRWSDELIGALEFPRKIFPEIVGSGTPLDPMKDGRFGTRPPVVVATCSHDTGAAVAGVPAQGEGWAYLSSGTWSLMGVELSKPVINEESRRLNFTNEIGYGNSVRLLKNLSGLWLLQECRRTWAEQGRQFDYTMLTALAQKAPAFRSLINPGSEEFLAPVSMPAQIGEFCRRTSQEVPENEGSFVRCALESLALLYRRTLIQLEALTGRRIDRLHVVGGGSNNALLNQFTADALQIPVFAGPAEATAAGNILIQAIAMGDVPSLAAARNIVRASSALKEFTPRDAGRWEEAFRRFQQLCGD